MASGASGSFSTNSPASPLSSVSLASPLSPFSPVPGCQASPTKQLGPEVSTGHTQPGVPTSPKPGPGPSSEPRASPEVCRRSSFRPRPKSCLVPRPRNHWEPDLTPHAEFMSYYYYGCKTSEGPSSPSTLPVQTLRESRGRSDLVVPVVEETDRGLIRRLSSNHQNPDPDRTRAGEQTSFPNGACRDRYISHSSESAQTCSDFANISADYQDRHGKLSSSRRWSLPEPQILLLQDSFRTDVLSFRCSQGLYDASVPEIQHHSPLVSQSFRHFGADTRPLMYPISQGQLGTEPGPSFPRNRSAKGFVQTNF